jgi:glycosyltransferase involved in cell wall biosynthesis
MNVCHIITKLELGGAQLTTFNILSRFPRNEYKGSLITSSIGMLKYDFLKLKDVNCYFLPFLHRPINPILDIMAFIHIYFILKRNKFSIVHTHSSKAGIMGRWAARLAGVPVIIHTVHGWSFNEYQHPVRKRLFMFFEKVTARITSRIICVSQTDLKIGLKCNIAEADKFELIKYGISIPEFRRPLADPLKKKRDLGIQNDDFVVGMISCLKPQKSPLDYVKAMARIYEKNPLVNFLLVGDGVLRHECENLIKDMAMKERFIFVGWRRDISEILDIMDVAVLTSKWEGMPISVIEALCKGCPVVATGVGGTPELIKNRVNGYITQPGAYEETAAKVLEIIKDTDTLKAMKRQAASSIDGSFCVNEMVKRTQNLYQGLS